MVPMGLSERPHIAQGIYIPSLKVLDGYRGPYTVGQDEGEKNEGKRKVQISGSLSVAPRAAAAVSTGNLHILGPTPDLSKQNV